jgi:hypothetical protein
MKEIMKAIKKLDKYPLNKVMKEIMKVIKSNLNKNIKEKLLPKCPLAPRIYGLPNIQDEGIKMRPIVNNIVS